MTLEPGIPGVSLKKDISWGAGVLLTPVVSVEAIVLRVG